MSSAARIVVVGSLNLDLVASVRRLPAAGETVIGTRCVQAFGGKGANQAVAAARQGAAVALIGCVGDDEGGRNYVARLKAEGIAARGVAVLPGVGTGTALIAVAANGENQIVCVPGANGKLSAARLRQRADLLRGAGAVLVQFETPLAAVVAACRLAAAAGARTVLNPSPWNAAFPWGRVPISTLVVNAIEARQVFGPLADDLPHQWRRLQRALAARRVDEVVITRGAESTLCIQRDHAFAVPALPVRPVDTVGAGDTFAGALAARLAAGDSLLRAAQYGNCAAGLATLALGAQASMPSRAATERALKRLPAPYPLTASSRSSPNPFPA